MFVCAVCCIEEYIDVDKDEDEDDLGWPSEGQVYANGHEVYSLNSIMSNISPFLNSNLMVVGFFCWYEGHWWFSD